MCLELPDVFTVLLTIVGIYGIVCIIDEIRSHRHFIKAKRERQIRILNGDDNTEV